jgi:hypothetical protein
MPHENLQHEANFMESVVAPLRKEQSKIGTSTNNKELNTIVNECVKVSEELHAVLEQCRAKQKSIPATFKAFVNSIFKLGKIEGLQKRLQTCQRSLQLFLAVTTW